MKQYFLFTILIVFHLTLSKTYSQCTANINFPAGIISVSQFNNIQQISNTIEPGNYFVANNFALGKTYQFTSSGSLDYITLRRNDDTTIVVAHGPVPFNYTIPNLIGPDVFQVHIHFTASCLPLNVNRTVNIQCTNCPVEPAKVGIANTNPAAVLDVDGKIKIGDDALNPQAGNVRWNGTDFEGYNGSRWVSFTKTNSNTWGEAPPISEVSESKKLTALLGEANDNFGRSVSIEGDYAIIGSFFDDIGTNTEQGSAYIFKRSGSTWIQQAKLTASDGNANDRFGRSVSISGDYAIIGSDLDNIGGNADQGSAYIFKRSGSIWIEEAKLTSSNGAANDYFGVAVAISGDYVIIGSNGDGIGGNAEQGSAYIFKRSGTSWLQEEKLIASDGDANDNFGYSVSISGDYAIIGAYFDDVGGISEQGSAYIFKRSGITWSEETKIVATDGSTNDQFGVSVSISDDYVIIGTHLDDLSLSINAGSAYVYKRNGISWPLEQKIYAYDSSSNSQFGFAVSISGNYAIIGAFVKDEGVNSEQGAAYIFKRSGTNWTQEAKLIASDGTADDRFGISVAIYSDYAIVGAYFDNVGGNTDEGSAYIFVKN